MFDWISNFIDSYGYLGIAALMLAENVFPPIPSELIMPMAGFVSTRGDLNPIVAVMAGTAGALLGASLWYAMGLWLGIRRLRHFAARHGRFLALRPSEIDQVSAWFQRHGPVAVLVGRLVPAVRTLISVPAGITAMPPFKFFAYSAVGTAAWSAALLVLGMYLGERYTTVQDYVNPVANGITAIAVLGYIYRVITWQAEEG